MRTMQNILVVILATGVIALGACAPRAKVSAPTPAPPRAELQTQSGGTATTETLSTNSGGTYPYGSASGGSASGSAAPVTGAAPPAQSTTGIIVQSPDGTIWTGPATNEAQYQTDVESCYSYAVAQVAHDLRIEDDRSAGLNKATSSSDFSELRGRMRDFKHENRRKSLFDSCMKSKGYVSK